MTEPKIAPWIVEAHEKQTKLQYQISPSMSVECRVVGIVDRQGVPVLIAWRERDHGDEIVGTVSGDGRDGCWQRLVPPRQTRKVWANLYDKEGIFPPGWRGTLYNSREDADRAADGPNRIACVPVDITFTPGEGLT